MSLTALDVQQQSFGTSRHGYDPQEVDVFLERVASEVDAFNRALAEAHSRIKQLEERASTAEKKASSSAGSAIDEEAISKAFIAAQKSADAMKAEARKEADKTVKDGEGKAKEILRSALSEKQKIMSETERLRESCERFRTEYLSMLEHFETDARKVLPQIEAAAPEAADPVDEREAAEALLKGNDATASAPAKDPFEPSTTTADVDDGDDDLDDPQMFKPGATNDFDDLDDDLDIEEID